MADVQGRCPACGGASLFLGEGGHVTCSRLDCPNPSASDDLLQGGEAALAQLLGGNRPASVVAHTLTAHGHSLADVRRMTDEQLLAVPGIGEPSLARIRAAIPAPERCCVCGGGPVTYHNYREQPFCKLCANCQCAQDPCVRTGINDPAVSASPPLRDRIAAALLDHLSRTADIRPGQSGELAFMPEVTDSERLRIADAVVAVIDPHGDLAAALERGHRCFLENHDKRLRNAEEALTARRGMVSGAEAAVARVRAEVARIRAVTRTWGPVADLIDAALDGIGQPREQRERPAHPDGTPYRYAEMVAEGWEFCDGCRMWSTATPERPHQCTETRVQGPVVGTARITVDVAAPKSADLADAVRAALRREARLRDPQ
ncbi:hypothetical protein ACFVAF_25135 [Streptomyces sp. NPDC057596]|uniref:hypothetical protein n=1 Tax=Streptomyces sp. NPDC057596 TaxID=3346178 RepID=UPI0036ACEC56